MVSKTKAAVLALGVCLLVGAPVRMVVKGLSNIKKHSSDVVSAIVPITITSKDKSLGNVRFVFSKQRNFNNTAPSAHLQGVVRVRGKQYPAGASKIGNKLLLEYPSRLVNGRQKINKISLDISSGSNFSGRIKQVPQAVIKNGDCNSVNEEHVYTKTVLPLNEGLPQNTALFVTLHTYADQQFYEKYGNLTNDQILSIVNAAEAIYTTQLGVRFKVIGQTILSQKDDVLNASEILKNFRITVPVNSETDLNHLFTGKDMNGSSVGMAYVGSLCYSPTYSYGVTQDYQSLSSAIFAHEIGHNFGANHSSDAGTLMYPVLSGALTRFSQNSVNEINTHLNAFGSCLTLEPYGPDLLKSTLTIKRMSNMIYGSLQAEDGTAIKEQSVILSINKKEFELTTNDKGYYYYFLKARKNKRKYKIFSYTKNKEKTSKTLRFKL